MLTDMNKSVGERSEAGFCVRVPVLNCVFRTLSEAGFCVRVPVLNCVFRTLTAQSFLVNFNILNIFSAFVRTVMLLKRRTKSN